MKKMYLLFTFLVSVFASHLSAELGIFIPYYVDPTASAIKPIIAAAQEYPTVPLRVILNPDNGVGSSSQSVYVTGSAALQQANIGTLGYVYTNYGQRPISEVEAEISNWVAWYQPNGIFLDEMDDSLDLSYYEQLTAFAKSLGVQYVMGNPGDNDLPTSAGPEVDTINVYENPGLPKNLTQFNKWQQAGDPPSKISLIAYGIETLPTSFITQAAPVFGWIYVTNKSGSNPYNGLPSYFSNLMSLVNSLN
jgi:hypothetical protein